MRHLHPGRTAAAAALVALAALPWSAAAASPAPSQQPFDPDAARTACTTAGGTVQERRPAFGTNGDQSTWLWLPGSIELCRFQTLAAPDDSRIYIDLESLVATAPRLATVAYLARIPMVGPNDGSNPATKHCSDLGGTSIFGTGAAGGGWVALDDPVDVQLATCVFADGSMIDEWGIAYYSGGTVRGIDLAPVIGYQPSGPLPPFFPTR